MPSRLAVPSLVLVMVAVPLMAQDSTRGDAANRSSSWKLTSRIEASAEYDGNVYLLPANKRDNVAAPSAADALSGRYNLMQSFSDVIGVVRAAVALEGSGLRGRDFSIAPAVGYEAFAQNAERRNVALSLAVAQDLRRDGRLRLRVGYRPEYFARNYLANATDSDLNGSITADERSYQRGDHRELGVELDYRHRLAKSRRSRPFGAFLHLGVGYADRRFDAPFAARDFSGATGSVRLEVSPRRGVEFETSYEISVLASPVTPQVILLDEPVFGEDFNGNGSTTDLNARAVGTVDRSRTGHVIGEALRLRLGRRSDIEFLVRYRLRTFSSSEPYDVANNGRRDQQLQGRVELTQRLAPSLRLITGLRYGTQRLNRRTDLGAEGAVGDYTQLQAQVGLQYRP